MRILVPLIASALLSGCAGQRADSSFTPRVARPAYATNGGGPTICVDQPHFNSHTADGLYRPFAALMIVNAAGGRTYKLFGLNLPPDRASGVANPPSRRRRSTH